MLRRWAFNLILLGVVLMGCLFLAEGAVRVFAPQPTGMSHQDRYGLALHWPGLNRFLPQYGHRVSFNSSGMRDTEHEKEKPAGVYRILVLGDSFMEALQVPFEESFPYLLGTGLRQATGKQVEVINAAVGGWGTDDELRYLTQYGLQWHPDLVLVVMTLHNDISDNLRQTWHALRGDTLVEQPVVQTPGWRYLIVSLKGYLASRFELYQLWRRVRHGAEMRTVAKQLNTHVRELLQGASDPQIERGYQLTRLLLARIDSVTRNAGGQTMVVMLPLQMQVVDSAVGRPSDSTEAEKPQDRVRDWTGKLGIGNIDLLPAFRRWQSDSGTSLFVQGEGHWNEKGHRLAAGAVVSGLVAAGVPR